MAPDAHKSAAWTGWTEQYELAFAVHLACAEGAFFAGERGQMGVPWAAL